MMKKIVLIFIFSNIYFYFFSNDNYQSFNLHGKGYFTNIDLPTEWKVDMDLANHYGIAGIFYPKKYNSNNTPVTIMCNVAFKPSEDNKLDHYIEWDLGNMKKQYKIQAKEINWKVKNKKNYKIKLYLLTTKKNSKSYQYVAYIDGNQKKYFVSLVLSFNNILMSDMEVITN